MGWGDKEANRHSLERRLRNNNVNSVITRAGLSQRDRPRRTPGYTDSVQNTAESAVWMRQCRSAGQHHTRRTPSFPTWIVCSIGEGNAEMGAGTGSAELSAG